MIGDEARPQFADADGRRPRRRRRLRRRRQQRDRDVHGVRGRRRGPPDRRGGRRPGTEPGGALLVAHAGASRASSTARLSYLLQDEDGQVADTHSISAGLDYPGVGPEHAYLRDAGLAEYVSASDETRSPASRPSSRTEGILPALEPAHVIGWLLHRPLPDGTSVLVCLSGRGDKDLDTVRDGLGIGVGGPARGVPARAARRRRPSVRALRHRRLSRASTRVSSAGSRPPAPTRSRSGSRSPTR